MTIKAFFSGKFLTSSGFYESIFEGERKDAYRQYVVNGFHRIFILSIVMAVIALFSFVRDLFAGFYSIKEEPFNALNLIAFTLFILLTAAFVSIRVAWPNMNAPTRVYTAAHYLFTLFSDAAILLLLFSEFSRGRFLCFQFFFFLFFCAVPLFKLRNNFYNFFALYVLISAEYLLIGQSSPQTEDVATNLVFFLLLVIGSLIFALYLRHFYLQTIISRYENLQLTRMLELKSKIDPLTGCLNRYALSEAFHMYCMAKKQVTMMMIDFDDFKLYNDVFSHVKGDECLKRVCGAMQNICSGEKLGLYRYGGEEFIILGLGDEDSSRRIALDVLQAVESLKLQMPGESKRPYVSVSIGITNRLLSPKSDLAEVIGDADAELYRAKKDGKACAYLGDKRVILFK